MALVRVKGLKAVSKTFDAADDAIEWAERQRIDLHGERKRGTSRKDFSTLTVAGVIREYLADRAVAALRSFAPYRLDWWVLKYGTARLLNFGVLALREARDALRAGKGVEGAPPTLP